MASNQNAVAHPFKINADLVCHESMMDVCRVQKYLGDMAAIYSASALWGQKFIEVVRIDELRPATKEEAQTGMRVID